MAVPAHVLAFVRNYWPMAVDIQRRFNIPALVSISQAAIETGWGRAVLPGTNNLFNTMCHSTWTKCKTVQAVEEVNGKDVIMTSRFRVYTSVKESFEDYAKFLTTQSLYKDAFSTNSPEAFIREIHRPKRFNTDPRKPIGYATRSTYASDIITGVFPLVKKALQQLNYNLLPWPININMPQKQKANNSIVDVGFMLLGFGLLGYGAYRAVKAFHTKRKKQVLQNG